MNSNLGTADRIIRLILAALVVVLFATDVISGTLAITLLILATVLLLTSMINFCPLYKVVGISTQKTPS